jgi:hypothetical protein
MEENLWIERRMWQSTKENVDKCSREKRQDRISLWHRNDSGCWRAVGWCRHSCTQTIGSALSIERIGTVDCSSTCWAGGWTTWLTHSTTSCRARWTVWIEYTSTRCSRIAAATRANISSNSSNHHCQCTSQKKKSIHYFYKVKLHCIRYTFHCLL